MVFHLRFKEWISSSKHCTGRQTKTAFSIPGSGLWQWRVLPFGLINSPSMFERLMERVFAGLTFLILLLYLDDIIVYSKTFEDHLENLKVVFERLKNANLKLNPKKCSLLCTKVAFLGFLLSKIYTKLCYHL